MRQSSRPGWSGSDVPAGPDVYRGRVSLYRVPPPSTSVTLDGSTASTRYPPGTLSPTPTSSTPPSGAISMPVRSEPSSRLLATPIRSSSGPARRGGLARVRRLTGSREASGAVARSGGGAGASENGFLAPTRSAGASATRDRKRSRSAARSAATVDPGSLGCGGETTGTVGVETGTPWPGVVVAAASHAASSAPPPAASATRNGEMDILPLIESGAAKPRRKAPCSVAFRRRKLPARESSPDGSVSRPKRPFQSLRRFLARTPRVMR